jgi:hypothetical protein
MPSGLNLWPETNRRTVSHPLQLLAAGGCFRPDLSRMCASTSRTGDRGATFPFAPSTGRGSASGAGGGNAGPRSQHFADELTGHDPGDNGRERCSAATRPRCRWGTRHGPPSGGGRPRLTRDAWSRVVKVEIKAFRTITFLLSTPETNVMPARHRLPHRLRRTSRRLPRDATTGKQTGGWPDFPVAVGLLRYIVLPGKKMPRKLRKAHKCVSLKLLQRARCPEYPSWARARGSSAATGDQVGISEGA